MYVIQIWCRSFIYFAPLSIDYYLTCPDFNGTLMTLLSNNVFPFKGLGELYVKIRHEFLRHCVEAIAVVLASLCRLALPRT